MDFQKVKVAWIPDFPVEWVENQPLKGLPRGHPMTWMQVLKEELQKLPPAQLEAHVLVFRKGVPSYATFTEGNFTFHIFPRRFPRAPLLFWNDTLRIRSLLARLQPTIVHAWGTERAGALIASRLPFPYLVTIQGLLGWYRQVTPLGRYERFTAMLENISLKRVPIITTESRFSVDWLKARYPQAKVHQIEHAPAWPFHDIPRKVEPGRLRVLATGTIGHRKGTDLLLRALGSLVREFPLELVYIGGRETHPFLTALRGHIPEEMWKRTTFLDNLTPPQVAAEISRATICAMPTRADTSPNAVKEAVVAGVPVVASRIGGIPDYVIHGENGLLFESDDLDAFIAQLRAAFVHPLFSVGQVNGAILAKAHEYLSPKLMAQRFLQLYSRGACEPLAPLLETATATR